MQPNAMEPRRMSSFPPSAIAPTQSTEGLVTTGVNCRASGISSIYSSASWMQGHERRPSPSPSATVTIPVELAGGFQHEDGSSRLGGSAEDGGQVVEPWESIELEDLQPPPAVVAVVAPKTSYLQR